MTEYGTDAANGVIVITTKHGTAGAPRWNADAEHTGSDIPVRFPTGYYSWGHIASGANTPVNCTLIPNALTGYGVSAGNCVVDSVTQWNPLDHAATLIFGTGERAKYDLSVSGGSDVARYFIAGGVTNETGVIRMPPVFKTLADTADLELPGLASRPNVEQQRSVRASTALRLGPTADMSVTASYLSTFQQTPDAQSLYYGVFALPALDDAAHNYGYEGFGSSGLTPLGELTLVGSQNTGRVVGGLSVSWRPLGWLEGHTTAGFDHGSQSDEALTYPLANPTYLNLTPFLGVASATTDVYSFDGRLAGTASLGSRYAR